MPGDENSASAWRLTPCVKEYAWGKIGESSAVYQYTPESPDLVSKHMAELWAGTHYGGQAILPDRNGSTLNELLDHSGTAGGLPYLFKILSISRALSIQMHPDKQLAEILHLSNPQQYPDANDKPEMVVALTDMRLLHGIRPLSEILYFCETYPQFAELWKPADCQTNALESICTGISNLMSAGDATVRSLTKSLRESLNEKCHGGESLSEEESLFIELNEQHPDDLGAWFVFILNIKTLRPFEALLTSPNEPHSYISGDCFEAMNCSNNVIRIGLTDKFKDTPSFLRALSRVNQKCNRGFSLVGGNQSRSALEFIPAPVQLFPCFRILVVRLDASTEVKIRLGTSPHLPSAEAFQIITIVHEGTAGLVRDEFPALELPQGTVWVSCCTYQTKLHFRSTAGTPALIAMCVPNTLRVLYEE